MKTAVRFAMVQGALGLGAAFGAGLGWHLAQPEADPPGIAQRAAGTWSAPARGSPVVDGTLGDWEGFGTPAIVRTASGAQAELRVRVDGGGLVVAGEVHDDVIDAGPSPITGDRVDVVVRADGPIWSERTFRIKPGGVSVAWEDGPLLGPCCASEGVQWPTATGWAFELRIPARELPAGRRPARLASLAVDLFDEDGGVPKAMARADLQASHLPPVREALDVVPSALTGCAAFSPGDDSPIVVRDGEAVRQPVPARIAGDGGVGIWESAPCTETGVLAITGDAGVSWIERRDYALARVGPVDGRLRLVFYRFAPGDRHRVRLVDVDEHGTIVEDRELLLTDDGDPATIPVDGVVELDLTRVSWTGALADESGARKRRTLGLQWDAESRGWKAL